MILAPTLSLHSLSAGGYDPDAKAYFAAAGVTDPAAKAQISAFAKGVKALGLWNSLVCWPLRSSQNAGTGTTAYSLGGLGTYNGTLVNGPTWGVDGVSATDTQEIEVTGFSYTSNNIMLLSSHKSTTGSFFVLRNDLVGFFAPFSDARVYFDAPVSGGRIFSAYGGRTAFAFIGGIGGASNSIRKDSAELVVGTGGFTLGMSGNLEVIKQSGAGTSVSSFAAILQNRSFSDTDFNAVRALYKNTLGVGLGLP